MIQLIVNNSYSQLVGLSKEQYKLFRELLSYMPDPAQSKFSGNYYKKYLLDKKGNFPTGLLKSVLNYLTSSNLQFVQKDARKRPQPQGKLFSPKLPFPLYSEQKAIGELPRHQLERGTISAVTGFGKSLSMLALINSLQLRTLIIVPNLSLKRQLTDSFTEYFGKEALKSNILIENIDSRSLVKATDYDVLLIDEAHHSASKTYRTLNDKAWRNIFYRYCFTATPWRTQEEEQILLESIAGQVIYEVSYQTAVNQGYIVPVDGFYITVPKTHVSGQTWAQVYSQLVVNNETRNQDIAALISKLHANKVSTLCIVKEIKHGEILSQLTGAPFASGVNDETPMLLEWFASGKLKTLIGTTGIVGEGTDSKAAEYIIIAGLGKSRSQFLQQCGRGIRRFGNKESCKVILIKDASHKFSKAHFKEQMRYLVEEYGTEPLELKFNS